MEKLKNIKARCLEELRSYVPTVEGVLKGIEERVWEYITDAIREDMDTANVYELLGIRKFLRVLRSYDYNVDEFRNRLVAIEGVWKKAPNTGELGGLGETGRWEHMKGGLKFSTPRGEKYVRLIPYQVYVLAGIFGATHDVDMKRGADDGQELLASEYVKEGKVYDRRRLVIEAHVFQTRKSGKTEFGGAIDFTDLVLGPNNGQVLIAANSREQAKIAFGAVKRFATQLDPRGKIMRATAEEINWKGGMNRSNSVKAMSAGGKTKDGLYGSIVHADEHGSAEYVRGHSDMQDLVEVCWGSTGPRREPLLLHTTTAGNVTEGPYQLQLRTVEASLADEMEIRLGEVARREDDYWFALLLRLDPWEVTDDLAKLDHENLFRKVNRSIGVTVQPNYYHRRIKEALDKGEDTRREVLTKDFNIWQSARLKSWLGADELRALQTSRRIDDIQAEEGWVCYGAMDFSRGDDLNTQTYLLHRMVTDEQTGENRSEWFFDCDCWVTENQLTENHNAYLYKLWAEQGWLHVMPGAVIDEKVITERWMEVVDHCTVVRIGYDNYDAKRFINAIGSWLQSEFGIDPKSILRPVSQTWAAFNGAVQEVTYMVRCKPRCLWVSGNPIIPWCFGNASLSEDRMENVKPVKVTEWGKVDVAQCMVMGCIMQDEVEGGS